MNPTVITPELTLDWDLCTKILSGFIQSEVRRAGFHRVIVGLSGGVDSSLAASLAAAAMGPGNVWGVGMPYKASSPESLTHARLIAEKLGINFFQVDITPQIDAYFAAFPEHINHWVTIIVLICVHHSCVGVKSKWQLSITSRSI